MKDYSFYLLDSGRFTGAVRTTSRPRHEIHAPAGQGLVEGRFSRSQRIDLESGAVFDCPEIVDEDARRERIRAILAELRTLDESLIRSLGELALDASNVDARSAAERIANKKGELRGELRELQA